jgi:hypothetical protein
MIGPTDLLHPSPAAHFKTFQAFRLSHIPNYTTEISAANAPKHYAINSSNVAKYCENLQVE